MRAMPHIEHKPNMTLSSSDCLRVPSSDCLRVPSSDCLRVPTYRIDAKQQDFNAVNYEVM